MGKKLQSSYYVRYLGRYTDKYLNWLVPHINHLSQKLVKGNVMLCQLPHYVNEATIKSILYAILYADN